MSGHNPEAEDFLDQLARVNTEEPRIPIREIERLWEGTPEPNPSSSSNELGWFTRLLRFMCKP